MKGGYITYRYPGRKTLLKKYGRRTSSAVPPKISLSLYEEKSVPLYECQSCHIMTAETELLLCDYPLLEETCDRMVCFTCAHVSADTIPEGKWYCKIQH